MSILPYDTEFSIPADMPPETVRTSRGIVIGRWHQKPAPKLSGADAQLQRALLSREPADGGWRSVAAAVVIGIALAAMLFFG